MSSTEPISRVMHVMRTYGSHGGEQQLARYFGVAVPAGDVSAFCFLYRDRESEALFRPSGILMHSLLPFPLPPARRLWLEILMLIALLPLLQLRLIWRTWRSQPRVCVVHGFQAAVVAWPAAILLRQCKFVYVHRGTKSERGKHGIFRVLYQPYAVIVGVSRAVAESLQPLLGSRNARVIESGIDWRKVADEALKCRKNRTSGLVVCSIGRLMPAKGQRLLLQAFAELRNSGDTNTQLWLVGEGPFRSELVQEAAKLGIQDSVKFLGKRNDVAFLLGMTDIFLFASLSEGLSNAVLEAMAAGVPSVVVDAPGVTECHEPGVTGIVVERRSDKIAHAMRHLIADPAARQRMGTAAQQRVSSHYSLEANRSRYRQLYEELGAFN